MFVLRKGGTDYEHNRRTLLWQCSSQRKARKAQR